MSEPLSHKGRIDKSKRSLAGTGTLAEGGYGLHNGVPYGDALVDEAATFERQHLFWPGAEKLRAATKKALGRGL